ncbi:hypothetical protein MMC20_007908 [Loxospora ochrophaea]|nr:hypothetical protein [Loxospora ochrophaea]
MEILPYQYVLGFMCSLATLRYAYFYIYTYFSEKRKDKGSSPCELPSLFPHKDPFFGLDAIWDGIRAAETYSFLKRQRVQYAEYGATYLSKFFATRVINTIEPRNIQAVLSTQFIDYEVGARRKNAFAPLLGREHSIFQLDGVAWKDSRGSLRPCFAWSQIIDLGLFEIHTQGLIKALPVDKTKTIDLGPLFLQFAASVAIHLVLGAEISSQVDTSSFDDFLSALHTAQRGCEQRWQLGPLASFFPMRSYHSNLKVVHSYMESSVSRAVATIDHQDSQQPSFAAIPASAKASLFLRSLLKSSTNPPFLHSQLLTILIAGTDTVAANLTNLFHTLATHPHVWSSLRAEVSSLNLSTNSITRCPRPPSLTQLRSLKYVHACIAECHRLYPELPSNSRIAVRDTMLPTGGGMEGTAPVFVPKGGMVAWSITALHRRQDLWGEDAEDFKPERFLGTVEVGGATKQTEAEAEYRYLPFNTGPRVCMGREFATVEVAYLLVRLVQMFEKVEQRDEEEWVEGLAMACKSKNGAKVRLVPLQEREKMD